MTIDSNQLQQHANKSNNNKKSCECMDTYSKDFVNQTTYRSVNKTHLKSLEALSVE